VLICLSFVNSAAAYSAIAAGEIIVPQQLGVVQSRADGAPGKPFIFVIGEEHVSLKVQQAVADILRYLSGTYDVRVVCTEGYDKPLVVPREETSIIVRRFIARSDLMGRRISGVEYFARAHPDVSVIGVEDMAAYEAHGQRLDEHSSLAQEAKQWEQDFNNFLTKDLGSLKVNAEDGKRFQAALQKLIEDQDIDPLTKTVHGIFGSRSAVGKKITVLNDRREALEKSARSATAESPEMGARDRAMIAATVRVLKDRKSNVAALVVGKLHLEGIESLLRDRNFSFVCIVPVGVEERVTSGPSEVEQEIYEAWRHGKKTGLEAWLVRFKPVPAMNRPAFRDRTALIGILATADHLRRQGMSRNEVLRIVNGHPLPNGISVDRLFAITGGEGIEFTANGKKGYAYFAGKPDQVKAPNGLDPVEIGEGGGRYYAVYGSGGSKPPIPPRGGGGGISQLPPDGFQKTYLKGIAEQKKRQKDRVTIRFAVEDGSLVRWVDDGPKIVLAVSPSEVENLRKDYENATLGPDKLFAAQKLADALLVELDEQFPEGHRELVQMSENDVIGDISLPLVQELARIEDANRLESIDKRRVYVIPWKNASQEVPRLGRKIKDSRLKEKSSAMDVIEKETEGATLRKIASKSLDMAARTKLLPAVDVIARATPYTSI
jgi:hypothetical protein